jgi:hypothetical protein
MESIMAKIDWSQIKPIPGFDSQKWLRKVRAEMQRENEGMTGEQIRERERQAAEREVKRRAERAKTESANG